MLTENWESLAKRATKIYADSLAKTLELFPFDDETYEKYKALPSAIGSSVTDFGTPAKIPIDEYKKTLSKEDAEITEQDPYKLLGQIRAKKYTAVQVLTAYFHAAIIASKLVNCIYEFLPEEALAFAKGLDESGKTDLPFFGLPLSLKEMIPVPGRSVTHGSLCYLDRVVDHYADIVNILIAAGAVPFVRTTNPQILMMLECESFTHGRTVNPYNSALTCGGSSGGEGSANGIGASPIGLGSDIGGSIRCPAAFNGIYGMRTTVGRIPTADYFSCQLGSESILSVTGPLTRSLDLLELLMKTVIDAKPWLVDPSLTSIEWRPEPAQRKYRIGILLSDGIVTPQPPVARALSIVKEKLSVLPNVELVEFKPWKHDKAWEIISMLYFEDGGEDAKSTLTSTGEPMTPQLAWVLGQSKSLTMHEQWHWNLEKQKYRKDYLKYWNSYNVDTVIAPVFPGPPCKHRTAKYWGYTAQWNLLDYPVLVFPVTKVDETLDVAVKNYTPLNEMDKFVYEEYDSPESFANAPVNLGAVGLRNTEEKLIGIGKLLRDIL